MDLTVRAAGDCGPHGVLVLMDLILHKGHNNVGRVVPLVKPSSVTQWVLGPLQGLDEEAEESVTAEAGKVRDGGGRLRDILKAAT